MMAMGAININTDFHRLLNRHNSPHIITSKYISN
jgi:hypothetical protein